LAFIKWTIPKEIDKEVMVPWRKMLLLLLPHPIGGLSQIKVNPDFLLEVRKPVSTHRQLIDQTSLGTSHNPES
jgi:hypothetical protein